MSNAARVVRHFVSQVELAGMPVGSLKRHLARLPVRVADLGDAWAETGWRITELFGRELSRKRVLSISPHVFRMLPDVALDGKTMLSVDARSPEWRYVDALYHEVTHLEYSAQLQHRNTTLAKAVDDAVSYYMGAPLAANDGTTQTVATITSKEGALRAASEATAEYVGSRTGQYWQALEALALLSQELRQHFGHAAILRFIEIRLHKIATEYQRLPAANRGYGYTRIEGAAFWVKRPIYPRLRVWAAQHVLEGKIWETFNASPQLVELASSLRRGECPEIFLGQSARPAPTTGLPPRPREP